MQVKKTSPALKRKASGPLPTKSPPKALRTDDNAPSIPSQSGTKNAHDLADSGLRDVLERSQKLSAKIEANLTSLQVELGHCKDLSGQFKLLEDQVKRLQTNLDVEKSLAASRLSEINDLKDEVNLTSSKAKLAEADAARKLDQSKTIAKLEAQVQFLKAEHEEAIEKAENKHKEQMKAAGVKHKAGTVKVENGPESKSSMKRKTKRIKPSDEDDCVTL